MSAIKYILDYRSLINENGDEVGIVDVCPLFALDDEEEILKYAYMEVYVRGFPPHRHILLPAFVYYKDITWHDMTQANYGQYKHKIKSRYPTHECHDIALNKKRHGDELHCNAKHLKTIDDDDNMD